MTAYQQAWNKYKASFDYSRAVYVLKSTGHIQPYIDNILEMSFAAGWNSREDAGFKKEVPANNKMTKEQVLNKWLNKY